MLEAANYSAAETLRNGERILIRALKPEDREGIIAAVAGIGSGSLYRRFFAVKRAFGEEETSYFLNPDFITHVALAAVAEEAGKPVIIGGARYVSAKPGQAEVAFLVTDKHQGQGIGAALMRHVVAIAREAGLRELTAEVLAENQAMLKVFERAGLPLTKSYEAGIVHLGLGLS
jgi:RimJ/RimL family protein N-acetyltransferase